MLCWKRCLRASVQGTAWRPAAPSGAGGPSGGPAASAASPAWCRPGVSRWSPAGTGEPGNWHLVSSTWILPSYPAQVCGGEVQGPGHHPAGVRGLHHQVGGHHHPTLGSRCRKLVTPFQFASQTCDHFEVEKLSGIGMQVPWSGDNTLAHSTSWSRPPGTLTAPAGWPARTARCPTGGRPSTCPTPPPAGSTW